ncbi:MAG: LacI family DNA-binding transcriptional regulator [Verrucomicrobia bacterium]|nr:LacI family DNA-binding transcriptional regulator [Verrucomicrobiota bacterium]MCH8525861.1 LacI family transcriptional regulator [Kiritimatiellia bacterium]
MPPPKSNPNVPVTYKDIADRCGLSMMTVSRVLRQQAHVKPETREKVEKAAEELGYRPNPMIQALMSGVRRRRVSCQANLAWVMNYDPAKPASEFLQVMMDAAHRRASQLGFGFETVILPRKIRTASDCRKIFEARGIVGVMLAPLSVPGVSPPLPWEDFPYATIGRSLISPQIHYTMAHFQHNMERVLRELAARDYRRVAYLEERTMDQRQDHSAAMVFEYYLRQIPARNRIRPVILEDWDPPRLDAWIRKHRPDVMISGTPQLYELLLQTGRTPPRDLGFVTLSWRESQKECAGIRQPFQELGSSVVEMVVAQIHRNEKGLPSTPKAMLLEGKWFPGTTLKVSGV